MSNKRGKSWDFPNHTTPEEMEALYKAKIRMLEQRLEQAEAELVIAKEHVKTLWTFAHRDEIIAIDEIVEEPPC